MGAGADVGSGITGGGEGGGGEGGGNLKSELHNKTRKKGSDAEEKIER